jgi:hypothetical protein
MLNTFHKALEKSLIFFFVLCFVFVATYVPQTWNQPKAAEAAIATEGTAVANLLQSIKNVFNTTQAAASGATTAAATNNLWIKEYVLDGIAWMLAKQLISQMTSSIVEWINSGFEGSPAFVQDLEGFLTDVADAAVGDFIYEEGGPLSFLCSPFKLDIQLALEVDYLKLRNKDIAPACTLTGALENLDSFIAGDFTQGGWDAWLEVTGNPSTYTPYGSYLAAEAGMEAEIANRQKREEAVLNFGQGFLSSRVCEPVDGSNKEKCSITTPGKVINEALTFQLSSGPRSLITADEIDEVVGALIGQIAQQAITGANGLLGLSDGSNSSGGEGYNSYIDATRGETTTPSSPQDFEDVTASALLLEQKYKDGAVFYQPYLLAASKTVVGESAETRELLAPKRAEALAEYEKIPALIEKIDVNISNINASIAEYTAIENNPDYSEAEKTSKKNAVVQRYYLLSIQLHDEPTVTASLSLWKYLTGLSVNQTTPIIDFGDIDFSQIRF